MQQKCFCDFEEDAESLLGLYLTPWPSCWRGYTQRKPPQQGSMEVSRHHCWLFSLSCVTVTKLERRRTASEVAQTEQAQGLLKLNNSWLTELSWPWKIPSVGTVETWHCSFGAERRSWDRQIQTNKQKQYICSLPFGKGFFHLPTFGVSHYHF